MSNTSLNFHELSFLTEGENVLVGRPGTASYAVLPLDGASLLEKMVSGASPADAAAWYETTYGDPVDIGHFVNSISGLGFLREYGADAAAEPERVGLQVLSRAIFSRPAFAVYALVVGAWLVTIVRNPSLAPRPSHVFFTHYLVLVQLLLMFGQLPLLFLHEGFHVLGGRRLGLPSHVGLGRRLWVIVVETRMPDLLAVPRGKRYLPFLAGMLLDVLVVSSLGLVAYALRGESGTEHVIAAIALAMAFPVCIRFAYQFLLFLQTDIYFVIATALGCYDLHAAARAVLTNGWWRLVRRPERAQDEGRWTPRDRLVARWYAPFFAVGAGILLALTVETLVPIITGCIHLAVTAITSRSHGARFWDAVLFITLTVGQFGVYLYALLRNRAASVDGSVPLTRSLETE